METQSGIILKTCYSRAQDVTVLDRQLGKIKGRVHSRNKNMRVSQGSQMSYLLTQRGSSYAFEVLDLEHVPFAFARRDIFFLHHILELCYYFLPEGCAVADVFDLLAHLFQSRSEKLRLRRRLILTRLFLLFGMHPEHEKLSRYVDVVIGQPLDQLVDIPVDVQINTWLDQWIWTCIMSHPHKERFKTVWLLKRAESHES